MKKRQSARQDNFDLSLHGYKPIIGKNSAQKAYLKNLHNERMVIGVGPAGTGKTYLAATYAIEKVASGEYERVVLTRATVPIDGEDIGFLPGTLEKKMEPWTAEIFQCFRERVGHQTTITMLKDGRIQIVPFAFMRGRTFKNSVILADEMQNATPSQAKALVTRIGEGSKMLLNGDPTQSDLKNYNWDMEDDEDATNGLEELIDMIQRQDLPIPISFFTSEDVVRDPLCQLWVQAYENRDKLGMLRLVS